MGDTVLCFLAFYVLNGFFVSVSLKTVAIFLVSFPLYLNVTALASRELVFGICFGRAEFFYDFVYIVTFMLVIADWARICRTSACI
jgi:hypothetical protein